MGAYWHPFADMAAIEADGELVIASGQGAHVTDESGRRYFDASVNMRRSNNEHRRIFEAISKGASERANKLAQAHVLQGRQRLLATLDD